MDSEEETSLDSRAAQIKALRSGSTRLRTEALKKILHDIDHGCKCSVCLSSNTDRVVASESDSDADLLTLLPHIVATYPRYSDRKSRKAVQACLSGYLKSEALGSKALPKIADFLSHESSKAVIAPSNAFVLLDWCCLVQQSSTQHSPWPQDEFAKVCSAAARLLAKCEHGEVRSSIQHSALVVARRGLRQVLRGDAIGEQAFAIALKELTSGPNASSQNAAYLGVLCGVSARIPGRHKQMQQNTGTITDFYLKQILASKTVVSFQQVAGLRDFFEQYLSESAITETVVPFIEKGILRSGEVILHGPVSALAQYLDSSIDLSPMVQSRLLKPLLSSLGSTNVNIRDGACQTLLALLRRGGNVKSLRQIAVDLMAAVKASKASNHELRGLLSDALMLIPADDEASLSILQCLVPAATKEANELAFRKALKAIAAHMPVLLQHNLLEKTVADSLLKNSSDKRPPFRKAWILCLASALSSLESVPDEGTSRQFLTSALKTLRQVYDEVAQSTLPAAQSGLLSAAYGLPGLLGTEIAAQPEFEKDFARIPVDLLSSETGPSFLLNPKAYARVNLSDDQHWFIRALFGVVPKLSESSLESKTAWARAILHSMLSTDADSSVRRESGKLLSQAYLAHPKSVGASVVLGVWSILEEKLESKPSEIATSYPEASHLGDITLTRALNHIVQPKAAWDAAEIGPQQAVLEDQAVKTVVLMRPELIAHGDWIDSCLVQGLDPGSLAKGHSTEMLNEILSHYQKPALRPLSSIEVASCSAATSLAFVSPEDFTPVLVDTFRKDLNTEQFAGIGPTEAAIARAPEGSPFVDILSQGPNGVVDNNRKDRDILKWEEQTRKELSQKKGSQPKKLTADEQAKVNQQLKYESGVRQQVEELSIKVRRGARFIQSLAEGPPTDARLWMSPALDALLGALNEGASMFVDWEIYDAYIACSNQVSERLEQLRPFIGIATLRSLKNVRIPDELTAEPLGELATRVLYRLRFAAEQRAFDTASLAYMLPLIFSVLDNKSIGDVAAEDAEAQVLLALEFLSFQMSSCEDAHLPRASILRRLITAMQNFPQHHRILRDSLNEFCRAASGNITLDEVNILLTATTVHESSVRGAAVQAIESELDLTGMAASVNIWIACQDEEDEIAETALAIWEESQFAVDASLVSNIMPFLNDSSRSTRVSSAKALAQALLLLDNEIEHVLDHLKSSYREEAQPLKPKPNKYGIIQRGELTDLWERRSGIALALQQLASVMPKSAVLSIIEFLVSRGPLADRHPTVRSEMVEAGKTIVETQGKDNLEQLMKMFENVLQQTDQGTQEFDWTNEAVIVLYGSLAQHLPESDKRKADVVSKLIATLSTPSESVQYAVAMCLPPLVRSKDLDVSTQLNSLLEQLLGAKQYASRRGAAYGLAGIVKGRGVAVLRQQRIMSTLKGATENKKSPEHRQGAMFAYEVISLMAGRMFEPYVIEILPQLLACFGDAVPSVREACLDTAKTCFSSLSSFGVRKVLPQLLEGLDESQWRTKKGACDLLGAMAYLDPQQLATSLPDIIPPLTAVLTDSHKEVRAAANSSLQRFGEVITNPEVKGLVGILLKALSDPAKYTEDALDGLIKISFIHYLDAPSLALVVRILERGLGDRSSTKRKAAQIIGSLAHLTEKRDIVIHLPILVSGLRLATVDPVPATRATSSKALGSLVEKLGEDAFPELIPSLMASLRTDTGAGDRLGSAQALSEVLAGLGTGRLEETLPTILQNVASNRATVREGFMTLFIFLPACFGNSFANYLGQIIPSVLAGLADELEAIRETALRAGRLLVKNFATKAIDLLLPELQRGLADDSHRIRLSSVELVGDLLFSLTGTSAKDEDEADEVEEKAAQAGQSLLDILGEERRNRVLSLIYICRCDTSGLVRAAAINVWKALVATPRTLREIVPTLTQVIISRLASSNMEHKVIAGNALGEVIRKAGEGVFTALLPSLEEGLETSSDSDNRQGICMALKEIVSAASPDALEEHEKQLIAIVRLAIVDSNAEVREAAAESFDALQQTFGKRAVDQVLPHLLNLLRSESEAENALSALLTLLTDVTRANVILPNLIPTLLTNPITAFNARALASLARVGSSTMTRRLPTILNTLADNIIACKDDDLRSELNTSFDAILSSIDEFDGLNTTMSVMLAMIKHDDHRKRAVAATHLGAFFNATEVDYSRYNQDLIRVLLISFGDRDKDVVSAAWSALSQLQSHLRKEEMESLVPSTRSVLNQAGTAGSLLPGFTLLKGIQPVLNIFLQGLMNGSAEQRVQAAMGISDIIDRTSPDSLKPFVTQITGPLIRVVGERSMDVKCAILLTLNQLLEKIPTFLRPFLPQLQRTFTKSIADPSSDLLRARATKALSTLITLTSRVDPLIAELVTGSKTATDNGVKNAMLKGLQEVVSKVGANMSDASRESILSLMDIQNEAQDDSMTTTNARLLGAMIKVLPSTKSAPLIKSRVLVQPSTSASTLALNAVLLESADVLTSEHAAETVGVIATGITSKTIFIQQNSILAAGKYLLSANTISNAEAVTPIFEALASIVPAGHDIDSRRLSLVVIRTLSRHHDEVHDFLPLLVPVVFSSIRDPVIPVKLAAEAAFLELFKVVDRESAVWDEYIKQQENMPMGQKRPMTDYFKRVALRLGGQARERREAEGGKGGLGLGKDEEEDEREVWSVGRVEVGEGLFEKGDE
jgi:hypothetical protein